MRSGVAVLLVSLVLAVGRIRAAPAPQVIAPVGPVSPVVYSTPFSYSYSTFVSNPALLTPYAYPYSYGYPYYVV